MTDRKARTVRQNRPGYRKARGIRRVLIRDKHGAPKRNAKGNICFNLKKVKTDRWERV